MKILNSPCIQTALLAIVICGAKVECTAGVHLKVPDFSQPDDTTCLPTSTMMALHYLGRIDALTSDTVQKLQKTCQYNRFNVPALAREYGLFALSSWHTFGWTRDTVKKELDGGRPVVLGVSHGRYGHFVLAIGYTDDGRVIIHDPEKPATGYALGGPDLIVDWEKLRWQGGIMFSMKPFPPGPEISGTAESSSGAVLQGPIAKTLFAGETADFTFRIRNNGRNPWPGGITLCAVDVASSPTRARKSVLAVQSVGSSSGGAWICASKVMAVNPGLVPGNTTDLTFRIRAPQVNKATTFVEYFNLVESDGRWFSDNWLGGPGNMQMGIQISVTPKPVKAPL